MSIQSKSNDQNVLLNSLNNRGLLEQTKAFLRSNLYDSLKSHSTTTSFQKVYNENKDKDYFLMIRLAYSIVYDFIKKLKLNYTLNIINSEIKSILSNGIPYTESELLNLLNLNLNNFQNPYSNKDNFNITSTFLFILLKKNSNLLTNEIEVQTDLNLLFNDDKSNNNINNDYVYNPFDYINQQTKLIDEKYNKKINLNDYIPQSKLNEKKFNTYKEELDKKYKEDFENEIRLFKTIEISKIRLDENKKYNEMLEKIKEEYENENKLNNDKYLKENKELKNNYFNLEKEIEKKEYELRNEYENKLNDLKDKEKILIDKYENEMKKLNIDKERVKIKERENDYMLENNKKELERAIKEAEMKIKAEYEIKNINNNNNNIILDNNNSIESEYKPNVNLSEQKNNFIFISKDSEELNNKLNNNINNKNQNLIDEIKNMKNTLNNLNNIDNNKIINNNEYEKSNNFQINNSIDFNKNNNNNDELLRSKNTNNNNNNNNNNNILNSNNYDNKNFNLNNNYNDNIENELHLESLLLNQQNEIKNLNSEMKHLKKELKQQKNSNRNSNMNLNKTQANNFINPLQSQSSIQNNLNQTNFVPQNNNNNILNNLQSINPHYVNKINLQQLLSRGISPELAKKLSTAKDPKKVLSELEDEQYKLNNDIKKEFSKTIRNECPVVILNSDEIEKIKKDNYYNNVYINEAKEKELHNLYENQKLIEKEENKIKFMENLENNSKINKNLDNNKIIIVDKDNNLLYNNNGVKIKNESNIKSPFIMNKDDINNKIIRKKSSEKKNVRNESPENLLNNSKIHKKSFEINAKDKRNNKNSYERINSNEKKNINNTSKNYTNKNSKELPPIKNASKSNISIKEEIEQNISKISNNNNNVNSSKKFSNIDTTPKNSKIKEDSSIMEEYNDFNEDISNLDEKKTSKSKDKSSSYIEKMIQSNNDKESGDYNDFESSNVVNKIKKENSSSYYNDFENSNVIKKINKDEKTGSSYYNDFENSNVNKKGLNNTNLNNTNVINYTQNEIAEEIVNDEDDDAYIPQ